MTTASLDVAVERGEGESAAGVAVTAHDQTVETDDDGTAFFDGLPAGEPIEVTAELGGARDDDVVTLEAGERGFLTLSLGTAQPVEITALELVGPDALPPGASARAEVSVAGSGGDLTYEWAIGGQWSIDGDGDEAIITAPDLTGAQASIDVTVTDALSEASAERAVETVACEDPKAPCAIHRASTRHAVTLDTTPLTETLTDVPVLLSIDESVVDHAAAADDGADVRVTDGDLETLLDHEVEIWDGESTSQVWVRVPELPAGEEAFPLYLQYGDPDAEDAQDPAGVWGSGFAAVWHGSAAEEDEGSVTLPDSTGGGHAAESPERDDWPQRIVEGLVGFALELEGHGSDDDGTPPDTYFEAPASGELALEEAFTLEATVSITEDWREFDGGDAVDWAIAVTGAEGGDGRAYLGIGRREGGVVNCRVLPDGAEDEIRNDQPPGDEEVPEAAIVDPDAEGIFTYLACVYDGETLSSYIDGERVHVVSADPGGELVAPAQGEGFFLGRRLGDRRFGGALDAVRVSPEARSQDWIRAQELSIRGELAEIAPAREIAASP